MQIKVKTLEVADFGDELKQIYEELLNIDLEKEYKEIECLKVHIKELMDAIYEYEIVDIKEKEYAKHFNMINVKKHYGQDYDRDELFIPKMTTTSIKEKLAWFLPLFILGLVILIVCLAKNI